MLHRTSESTMPTFSFHVNAISAPGCMQPVYCIGNTSWTRTSQPYDNLPSNRTLKRHSLWCFKTRKESYRDWKKQTSRAYCGPMVRLLYVGALLGQSIARGDRSTAWLTIKSDLGPGRQINAGRCSSDIYVTVLATVAAFMAHRRTRYTHTNIYARTGRTDETHTRGTHKHTWRERERESERQTHRQIDR